MIEVIYPSIDRIMNYVDSKYQLVHIIGKRSRQMARENNYQFPVRCYSCKKNLGRALEEIMVEYLVVKKDTKK